MPERIRLSRAKGYRMPPNTRKVDRSTRWGNPFVPTQQYVACYRPGAASVALLHLHEPPSLGRALDLFAAYLYAKIQDDPRFLEPLRGMNLACWCPLDQPCHADILLRLANE